MDFLKALFLLQYAELLLTEVQFLLISMPLQEAIWSWFIFSECKDFVGFSVIMTGEGRDTECWIKRGGRVFLFCFYQIICWVFGGCILFFIFFLDIHENAEHWTEKLLSGKSLESSVHTGGFSSEEQTTMKYMHVVAKWEEPMMEEKYMNAWRNRALQRRMESAEWW